MEATCATARIEAMAPKPESEEVVPKGLRILGFAVISFGFKRGKGFETGFIRGLYGFYECSIFYRRRFEGSLSLIVSQACEVGSGMEMWLIGLSRAEHTYVCSAVCSSLRPTAS